MTRSSEGMVERGGVLVVPVGDDRYRVRGVRKRHHTKTQDVGTVSTSASILQEETSIDEFFKCNGDRDASRCSSILSSTFLEEFRCVRFARRGEHEIITHQHSSGAFLLLLQERLRHPSSHARTPEHGRLGSAVVSIDRRRDAVDRFPHRPRTRRRRGFDRFVVSRCRGPSDLTLLHRSH